ncbi:class I SAM-dependent methyltransferase [Brachybacterium halotolerans subsp. kimchii]|uniref:class I SAM-dependent methyltransferase n=1 Tax=Brachybacterium halotolerans TaxID=2795215 RepID=UPI001E520E27|nr:class I SAM-dependent methyltransferase [Brachybacterium halotolerans]UEJ81863.1 class I SAM-dependent methyltransferase [Brachybacterium halotolerans subsp. kimchii]
MSVQDRMTAYWSRWADEYDDQQTARLRSADARRTWRDVWERALAPDPEDAPAPAGPEGTGRSHGAPAASRQRDVLDVLDVGTGSGNAALQVAELGHRVTGIDLAPGMLERARAKASAVRFLPGDAIDPPFAEGAFDAIICRYVLWTLRDAQRAVAAWHRLLRPGGILAAVDSAWFPEGGELGEGLEGARGEDFRDAYGAGVISELPLAAGRDDEVRAALEAGGFAHVTATPLHEVLELDRRQGVAPGHHPQLQVLYRAVRA